MLADVTLDALECWSQTLPPGVINPYYSEILPCLDAYLKTPDVGMGQVMRSLVTMLPFL